LEKEGITQGCNSLLKPAEVALTLRVSIKTVHSLCRAGRLSYLWINGKERRFTREDIEAYLALCRVTCSPESFNRLIPGPVRAAKTRKGAIPQSPSIPETSLDENHDSPLPCASRGGDKKKSRSLNHGKTDRARLREEFRSW
jgi:excisionase family DNA binding protein